MPDVGREQRQDPDLRAQRANGGAATVGDAVAWPVELDPSRPVRVVVLHRRRHLDVVDAAHPPEIVDMAALVAPVPDAVSPGLPRLARRDRPVVRVPPFFGALPPELAPA